MDANILFIIEGQIPGIDEGGEKRQGLSTVTAFCF